MLVLSRLAGDWIDFRKTMIVIMKMTVVELTSPDCIRIRLCIGTGISSMSLNKGVRTHIYQDIYVTFLESYLCHQGQSARLGIDAPPWFAIERHDAIKRTKQPA